MRRQLVASGAAVTTALAVGLAISALPAVATHVEPETVGGNPTCSELVDGGVTEFKVEPVADGTYTDGTLTVTIDVRDTADGPVFDWTSNIGVDAVFAKGGPQGNLYVYDPEATGDTGLHAPVNPKGNDPDKWAGLSHISFCYDKDETTTTPPTTPPTKPPTTPPTTETPTPTEAPTTPVETPAPVPTEVPAGTDAGDGGSAGLVGLVLAGGAAVAGAAVFARRRFLHDS
jgi:hypothetical protein